ncbi:flagellar export chaperone FliS [Niameybacter massiliensis]|uniref:flagellar export chaperone FliS n=1 Tax=Niameybacter massiliensis TaxID=1658108 RepID=UPI0006B5182E|nr:flagellar export chaperone FliS [Niameybacter massiliensis]
MITNPYQQYQNNSIMTASPGELTLMLYNGAIKFCNLTLEAMEQKDVQKANQSNLRVQDIITELQATLDTKYEVGQEMDRLYTFIRQLLIEGNIQKNPQKVIDARELIREYRDTWQQVIKMAK